MCQLVSHILTIWCSSDNSRSLFHHEYGKTYAYLVRWEIQFVFYYRCVVGSLNPLGIGIGDRLMIILGIPDIQKTMDVMVIRHSIRYTVIYIHETKWIASYLLSNYILAIRYPTYRCSNFAIHSSEWIEVTREILDEARVPRRAHRRCYCNLPRLQLWYC